MMKQRVVAGVVLLFVFALGGLTGVFLERHHSVAPSAELSPQELHEAAMAEIEEFLELDEQQMEHVHAILANRQDLVQRAWEHIRPEVQSAMLEVHEEIAEILRPEQRARYHEWLSRQHDHQDNRIPGIPH